MSEKKIKVRHAQPKDVVNIFRLLRQGWDEQTVEYAPVNDLRSFRWILDTIEQGLVAVADLDGRIVGAAGVSPFQPPWSVRWMLDMEFLYVLPSFRKEGVHDSLLKAVESFADKYNLPMSFWIQTGEKADVKIRMMEMHGWTYVGGTCVRAASGQGQEDTNNDVVK